MSNKTVMVVFVSGVTVDRQVAIDAVTRSLAGAGMELVGPTLAKSTVKFREKELVGQPLFPHNKTYYEIGSIDVDNIDMTLTDTVIIDSSARQLLPKSDDDKKEISLLGKLKTMKDAVRKARDGCFPYTVQPFNVFLVRVRCVDLALMRRLTAPGVPAPGDFIATDWLGPGRKYGQRVPFTCSMIILVDGDRYKMAHDERWYTFKDLGAPRQATGAECFIYPAIPLDATEEEKKKLMSNTAPW